jgi:tRNA (guanosine-2'-O-)-methyltransferase
MKQELYNYLSSFITERRKELIETKVEERTKYITVALEDIFQSHNASAVIRTCDCFGIQDFHFIENENEYLVNADIALGASSWVNLIQHNQKGNNTLETINKLKTDGYRIVATVPTKDAVNLDDFDLNRGKIALFFGTELKGLSDLMIENADEFLKIPMVGFTESLNISVSAGVILHHLTYKLRKSTINWRLSDDEKLEIKTNWVRNTLKTPDMIEQEFLKIYNNTK